MIKILSIGNSFSQDATAYLATMAKSADFPLSTANLYLGGCSLRQHWHNLIKECPAYSLELDGETTGEMITISEALKRNQWDYITLQQVSHQSHDYNSYQPYLARLISFIEKQTPAEIILHQTWAYEDNSEKLSATGFQTHAAMFQKIQRAYQRAAQACSGCRIIPAGSIFYQLQKRGVTDLYRDTYHASIPEGRYILAAVWYEFFTGQSIFNASFRPEGLPKESWQLLQKEIHSLFGH